MSNYTTVAPVEVSTDSIEFLRQWQVAKSEPSPTTNYKTTNVVDDDFEYRTKYHDYDLQRLEQLERNKPKFIEVDGLLLHDTPRLRRELGIE